MAASHAFSVMLVLIDFVKGAYIGCFIDTSDRLLKGSKLYDSLLTTEKCMQWCFQGSYTYTGTQYSTQCFCGNSIDLTRQTSEGACDMSCRGKQSENCGGIWRMSVYTTEFAITTENLVTTTNAEIETSAVDILTTTEYIETSAQTEKTTVVIHTSTEETNVTMTLSNDSENTSCICKCQTSTWGSLANLTMSQKQEILSELQALLTVTKHTTSMFRRKLISKYDSRPSSVTMGYVAIAILSSVTAMIVVPDVICLVLSAHRWLCCRSRE